MNLILVLYYVAMIRRCDECGTRLAGKGHGFVKGAKVVCGRRLVQKSVRHHDGVMTLENVPTPKCGGP